MDKNPTCANRNRCQHPYEGCPHLHTRAIYHMACHGVSCADYAAAAADTVHEYRGCNNCRSAKLTPEQQQRCVGCTDDYPNWEPA